MSLYKRDKTWWTDFSVNGQRFRESLDTTDWREAQALQKELIAQASVGKLTPSGQQYGRLTFFEALDRYLADRLARVQPNTAKAERERATQLKKYFGAVNVSRISVDSILAYIAERKKAGMANGTINRDLDVLRGVLKRAKRWHVIAEDIRPLPVRHNVGRVLSHEEKVRLLKLAASRPEWDRSRLAMRLALNTTMRASEIRGLQWRDLNLMERTITVSRSKTEAGERAIPLNADALAAVFELRERAKLLLGAEPQPEWYVFPHAEGFVKPDPNKPMSGWRTAWRSLTRTIECPACRQLQKPGVTCGNDNCKANIRGIRSSTAGLRFHDLRHQAITELSESLASDQTIMSIAGHVSPKMLAHYSHVRMDAKRKALDSLSGGDKLCSYDTKHGTKGRTDSAPNPQVVEKFGGRRGDRTPGLIVANDALSQLS
jgi:integrase